MVNHLDIDVRMGQCRKDSACSTAGRFHSTSHNRDQVIFYPLIPVGLFGGTEIHGVPHILRLGQHGTDREAVPVIGAAGVHGVLSAASAVAGQIIGGALHLFLCEYLGNLMGAVPLHRKPEDQMCIRDSFRISSGLLNCAILPF